MNLLLKLKRYLKLRKMGMSHSVAWREFKYPLVVEDYMVMILVFAVIAIALVLNWKDEIDNFKISAIQTQSYIASRLAETAIERDKNEKLVISMYNGGIIENGHYVTWKRLNAGSVCE
jgi:hypothetical protein